MIFNCKEGATTIPQGSRVQEDSKRTASQLRDDDIVCPLWKHKEMYRIRIHRNTRDKHVVGIAYTEGNGAYVNDHAWNELCYSADTEVYTHAGFKLWSDVDENDLLAAVDIESNTFKLEKPLQLYKNHYTGKMIRMSSRDLDSLTTPAHRNFTSHYHGHKETSGWSKYIERRSEDILSTPFKFEKLPPLPVYDFEKGTDDDYNLGRLLGFTLGDGGKSTDNMRIYYHVKKQRKKLLLEDFYALGLVDITNRDAVGGYYYARLKSNSPVFHSCFNVSKDKYIDWEECPKNLKFMQGLLTGLMSSDGHITGTNAWSYSTMSEKLKNDVITLSHLLGRECSVIQDTHNDLYKITIKQGRPKLIKNVEEEEYEGNVYCASVSTGALLVRRNNKTFVSGNSMRYVDASDFDYYKPDGFRTQSTNNKQASTDDTIQDTWLDNVYDAHTKQSFDIYASMIKAGVAREQARGVLPLNVYTEFYWTISLQGLANFIKLRSHDGAQYEIRLYAEALKQLTSTKFPVSLNALVGE